MTYEKEVMEHYNQVAAAEKSSSLSTMKDKYIRDVETEAIISAVRLYMQKTGSEKLDILDVGCGNGYTLSALKLQFPKCCFWGLEKNDALREIAIERFAEDDSIRIVQGDILSQISQQVEVLPDVVISQRVIINLLDVDDQVKALNNLITSLKPNGIFVMWECFEEALISLNEARAEFLLPALPVAGHNLYLQGEITSMVDAKLKKWREGIACENTLSTHYYISRVLHDVALNGKPYMRNSHFGRFFSEALPKGIGDYSPLKFMVFEKL